MKNNTSDGEKASWLHDQTTAIRHSLFFDPERDGFEAIAGNYIVIKQAASIYAAFCHLQKDSIAVSEGEHIAEGTYLGNVGHSGNSTEPHLHFQLMDSAIIESANGLLWFLRPMKNTMGTRGKSFKISFPLLANVFVR